MFVDCLLNDFDLNGLYYPQQIHGNWWMWIDEILLYRKAGDGPATRIGCGYNPYCVYRAGFDFYCGEGGGVYYEPIVEGKRMFVCEYFIL